MQEIDFQKDRARRVHRRDESRRLQDPQRQGFVPDPCLWKNKVPNFTAARACSLLNLQALLGDPELPQLADGAVQLEEEELGAEGRDPDEDSEVSGEEGTPVFPADEACIFAGASRPVKGLFPTPLQLGKQKDTTLLRSNRLLYAPPTQGRVNRQSGLW